MKEKIDDPEIAEILTPKGYPLFAKRPPLDHGFYEAFNRKNVHLVDIKNKEPISEITQTGVTTSLNNYEFDIIEQKPLPKSYIKKFNDAIIFKDQNYIIINKWAGISSQSGTKVDISIDDIASQISFDNKKLQKLGRIHDKQQSIDAIRIAKQAGFRNFNLDLMHGLPEQKTDEAL